MIRIEIDLQKGAYTVTGDATEEEMARSARTLVNLKRSAEAPGTLKERLIVEIQGADVRVRSEGSTLVREERGRIVEGNGGYRRALIAIFDELLHGKR